VTILLSSPITPLPPTPHSSPNLGGKYQTPHQSHLRLGHHIRAQVWGANFKDLTNPTLASDTTSEPKCGGQISKTSPIPPWPRTPHPSPSVGANIKELHKYNFALENNTKPNR